jgi:hypothetical protein
VNNSLWPVAVRCPTCAPEYDRLISPRFADACCRYCRSLGREEEALRLLREQYGPPRRRQEVKIDARVRGRHAAQGSPRGAR